MPTYPSVAYSLYLARLLQTMLTYRSEQTRMAEAPLTQSTPIASMPSGGTDAGPMEWPNVPGYVLIEEIGRGGMGIVFKARQLQLNRIVAVKVIRKDRLSHADAIRRFRREVQAAARLTHPNIVTIYDADEDGDVHFYSMQFVDGMNLQRAVVEFGPMPSRLAVDLMRQAALGLQHAFEQGLVHRDVKPANMIVSPRPDYSATAAVHELRLLDLGLVRLKQPAGTEEGSNSALTEPGAVLGTVDYIAPEQARDPRAADIRADLYSLGCTFYYLLTGRVPFPGGTMLDKLDRHRWEEPPRVHRLRHDLPTSLSAVVQRLLSKRPEDRFQTPVELAAALETMPWEQGAGVVVTLPAIPEQGETLDVPTPESTDPSHLEYQRLKGLLTEQLAKGGFAHARTLVAAMLMLRPNDWDALTARAAIDRYAADASSDEWARFGDHTHAITCLALSPDDRWLASGSEDQAIRIWDLSSYRPMACCRGHTHAITSLAFHQGGRLLMSAADDKTFRAWDPLTGKEAYRFAGHVASIRHLTISPDDKLVLTAAGNPQGKKENVLRLWDLASRKEIRCFKGHQDQVNCGAFSLDGTRIVSGSNDGTVRTWDIASGKERQLFQGHVGAITSVAFTPDGMHVLYAGDTARLLDLSSDGAKCLLYQDGDAILSAAMAPDGLHFVTGSTDGNVRLWSVDSGRMGRQQQQRLLGIETVVRLWDSGVGTKPRKFGGHTGPVTSVAFGHQGLIVASGGADKTVRLWKIPTE